jgi:hypothetical protein
LREIAVTRRDNAHVGVFDQAATQATVLTVLQKAQQADLRLGGQCIHFVKEQGAPLRLRNQADLALARIGVGTSGVPEKLVFDQVIGQCAAIDRNERSVPTSALIVNGTRSHFLATAGFAADQDGGVVARDPGENRQHLRKASDSPIKPRSSGNLLIVRLPIGAPA